MANINNISSNSYSSSTSLYGSRNVLTGLASGMDTETMIQNSVTGYQTKISNLQKDQTKLEWKQDAYRDLIDQMYSIKQKYTSYTSRTNLASNAFFTNARTATPEGENAEAITASGVAKSDIQINAVTQLATAARYSVEANALNLNASASATGEAINWGGSKAVGQVKGTITLKYDTQSIDLDFDASDTEINTADGLRKAIMDKLKDVTVKTSKGTAKGNELFNVEVEGNKFTFTVNTDNKAHNGSSVYINSVSGNVSQLLGANKPAPTNIEDKVKNNSFTVGNFENLVKNEGTAEYLSGKTIEVTLDGTTKKIKIGDLTEVNASVDTSEYDSRITEIENTLNNTENPVSDEERESLGAELDSLKDARNKAIGDATANAMNNALVTDLQSKLNDAFGNGKVSVSLDDTTKGLHFDVAENSGSTLKVTSSEVGEMLGIGKSGVSNYFNTSKTLKDLLGSNELKNYRIAAEGDSDTFRSVTVDGETKYYDKGNNLVAKDNDDKWYRVDDKGEFLLDLQLNGKSIGKLTKDSALENVMTAINSSADSGVNVSYSNLTSEFVFTARETGAAGRIDFGDGLAARLFASGGLDGAGSTYTEGKDAKVAATVNGKELELTRSSNVIDMDGMKVTLKKTFNVGEDGKADKTGEAITFSTSTNSDEVVDTIKGFVDDVNKLLKGVYDAYATQPLTKSGSKREGYSPLSEEDKADMSENAIKAYEEKAKTGLLFGDTDLSQLYSKLLSAIQPGGADGAALRAIGLKTTYSSGVTQIELDESDLRAALDSDPDKVRNVFAKTKEGGSASDGLMASLKATIETYGSTSVSTPGVLVRKAGTKLGGGLSLLNNNLQKQIDNVNKQIESWQTKLSDKIDYYTRQFTQLEKLMSQMNNQSSMLADLMGG
jgi:flagellar hook-associated protein 2